LRKPSFSGIKLELGGFFKKILIISNVLLKLFPHPASYVGDFNSHSPLWDYEHNDADGNRLLEWMTLNTFIYFITRRIKEL
jgi:hypothetical protein